MKTACILFTIIFVCANARAQQNMFMAALVTKKIEQEAYVKNYMQRNGKGLLELKKNNTALLAFIESVLLSKAVPKELKNLAVIESGLSNKKVSNKGAAGPWQFMKAAARGFGLRVDSVLDERYDFYKSTFAAAKMLKQLHSRYKDWNLVVVAYNCGPGNLDKAIAKSGSVSFEKLQYYLPEESRNHVKKFISTTLLLDKRILTPTYAVQKQDSRFPDSVMLARKGLTFKYLQAGFKLSKIADKLKIPMREIKKWNSDFERSTSMHGYCWLILPAAQMDNFLCYKTEILETSIEETVQGVK